VTYLLVAIAAMTALAVLLRYGMLAGADPYGVNLLLRGVGAVVLIAAVVSTVDPATLGAAWREGGWSGLIGSAFFFVAGLASVKAVQLGHLGLSWTMLRCSMVLPVVASILVWRELPLGEPSFLLTMRLTGVVLAVAAVVLVGWDRMAATGEGGIDPADRRARRWLAWALAAFLAQGSWEIALRSTREYASDDVRLVFLAAGVGGAALLSLGAVRSMKARLGRRELAFGLGAGVLVLVVSVSRIWALRELPGTVVFPVTTISVMVMVQLAGMGIWKERVGARGWLGFATGLAGVLLLTLNPGGG